MRVAGLALGLCAATAWAQPSLLAEDFEQGIDAGSGQRWTFNSQLGAALSLSPQAAHRGDAGFRVVDTDAGAGAIANSFLVAQLGTATPGSWARLWVRLAMSNPGQSTFVMVGFAASPPQARQQVVSVLFDGGLAAGGFNSAPSGYDVVGAAEPGLADGGWHLVELGWLGVGTRDGGRVLYVDGQLTSAVTNLDFDWPQQPAQEFRIGEPFEDDARFTGRFDFDDARVSVEPPGSRVSLRVVSGAVQAGQCVVLGARLTSSVAPSGPSVSWPIDVQLAVTASAGVIVFNDAVCSATGPIDIGAGTGERTFSVRASTPGASTVSAQFIDFLPAALPLVFSAAADGGADAGLDGGADGGSSDAGSGDAGSGDAGSGDAGSGDAGSGDAGSGDAGSGDAGSGDAGVGDAGSGDAGVGDGGASDGGVDDGGASDAGVDAGVRDAGSGDAGSGDAGFGDAGVSDGGTGPGVLPEFGVGCGCQSAPSLAWLLAVLALWRRRGPKR